MSKFTSLVDAVAKSLINEPEDWRNDEYGAWNRKRHTRIWLANSYYGMELRVGDASFGGVTLASSFFGWLYPWRRRLYRLALPYCALPNKQHSAAKALTRFYSSQNT